MKRSNPTSKFRHSHRPAKRIKKRKFKFSSVAPALIIEALAIVIILALFVGGRADLRSRMQNELGKETPQSKAAFGDLFTKMIK